MEKEYITAPLMPVPGTLLLPGTMLKLKNISRKKAQILKSCVFVLLADHKQNHPEEQDSGMHHYGVSAVVENLQEEEDGTCTLDLCTLQRVVVNGVFREEERGVCCTYWIEDEIMDMDEKGQKDFIEYVNRTVSEICSRFQGGSQILRRVARIEDINELIVYLGQYMTLSRQEKLDLLQLDSVKERSLRFIDYLLRQKESIQLQLQMSEKFTRQASESYRRQALQRQLEAIQEELNGPQEESGEPESSFAQRIEASGMPEANKKQLLEEARKLESGMQQGMEADILRNYLEFALALPWKKEEVLEADLQRTREILNSRHYGMDKVKERIVQHLAIMKLRKSNKGSALLLVGPPGTGKTSLGRSIAEAMGRPYTRMSLGGIRDEAEIRGHRRTYVGALAGRVLQTMKQAGSTHPVMILDEIDKMMQGGFAGDPAAAMLEVLDPEQNATFTDHYLDMPYDLSDVFFIGTANSLDSIPAPLLDRMEVIQISSYTTDEKFHIAKDYLVPEVLQDYGVQDEQLQILDESLKTIIDEYTMEAGCRGLKKRIQNVVRAYAEELLASEEPIVVEPGHLDEILGTQKVRHEKVKGTNPSGVVTGLAWTAVGGEVLFIEAAAMPGNGQMILTGQLGDVMKESARISLSVLKSRLPKDAEIFKDCDIHIHVPAGATPKDGPSAGITLFTALASLASGIPVDAGLAMTGELSLRGEVMPIGGLKEKLFGALRAGIKTVLIPWDNRQDLLEVPESIKEALEIIPVKTAEEVLAHALRLSLPQSQNQMYMKPCFLQA